MFEDRSMNVWKLEVLIENEMRRKKISFNESKSFLGECMEWFWVYYKGDNLVVLL